MQFAADNGMTTLEMTRAGKNLQKLTQSMTWEEAAPLWERLSKSFAEGAKGTVHVFHNGTTGVRIKSVWATISYIKR